MGKKKKKKRNTFDVPFRKTSKRSAAVIDLEVIRQRIVDPYISFFFFLQYEALLVNVGFRAVPHDRSHMDSVVKVRETNGLLSLDTC